MVPMSKDYFGEVRARLGEAEYETRGFGEDARISPKTVQRVVGGAEVDPGKQMGNR